MDLREYIKMDGNSGTLNLRIIPNAKTTMIGGLMGDGNLKIRINSIPEDGKANKELISFISKELGLKKNAISILSGITCQNKRVKIDF